ncbi:hypothetical protein [Piscinibacter koreensis]|nr:hypothetical protein [Schlegelella koreensis]
MPADLMAIAYVRRVLLDLGFEEVPERLVPASLGLSLWVSLPISELTDRSPKQLVADDDGRTELRQWIADRLAADV